MLPIVNEHFVHKGEIVCIIVKFLFAKAYFY